MPTHPVKDIIDGQPTFDKPLASILSELKRGGALQTLDPIEYITDRQRRWYRGICLPTLSAWNGDTIDEWDCEVKKLCGGLSYLKRDIFFIEDATGGKVGVGRLTTKGVGKRNMTNFIEEILSQAMTRGWPVSAPDPELRRK